MAGQLPLVPLPLARARSANAADGDARNVRQRVEMPPAPTPATLAAMPPQVVEVLVEQAALAARDAPNPPEAICEWMKAFCRALGARACPDDLFRRALAAWGFVPKEATREAVFPNPDPDAPGTYVNLRGERVGAPAEAPPPAWAGFGTWRSLFAGLCEAWYGRLSRLHDDYEHGQPGSMWIDATRRLTRRDNTDQAEIDRVKARFVNLTMSQREKDTLIDSLLTNVDGWVDAVAREEWPARLQSGEGWGEDEFEGFRDMKLHTYWLDWRSGINLDVPNYFRNESGPWRAVFALLAMRGARVVMPRDDFLSSLGPLRPVQAYEQKDVRLYRLVVYAQRGELALDEEQLKYIRWHLEEGFADPNRDMNLLNKGPVPHWPPGYEGPRKPPTLIVAIWMRSGPLVKLLLEFGATSAFAGTHGLFIALLSNMGRPGWTVEKEDTLKLLGTLREEVERLDRDTRHWDYDGYILPFMDQSWPENRAPDWPPVPAWMRTAVYRMLGPGPTPQA
jgi:hypothetical protein